VCLVIATINIITIHRKIISGIIAVITNTIIPIQTIDIITFPIYTVVMVINMPMIVLLTIVTNIRITTPILGTTTISASKIPINKVLTTVETQKDKIEIETMVIN